MPVVRSRRKGDEIVRLRLQRTERTLSNGRGAVAVGRADLVNAVKVNADGRRLVEVADAHGDIVALGRFDERSGEGVVNEKHGAALLPDIHAIGRKRVFGFRVEDKVVKNVFPVRAGCLHEEADDDGQQRGRSGRFHGCFFVFGLVSDPVVLPTKFAVVAYVVAFEWVLRRRVGCWIPVSIHTGWRMRTMKDLSSTGSTGSCAPFQECHLYVFPTGHLKLSPILTIRISKPRTD